MSDANADVRVYHVSELIHQNKNVVLVEDFRKLERERTAMFGLLSNLYHNQRRSALAYAEFNAANNSSVRYEFEKTWKRVREILDGKFKEIDRAAIAEGKK